MSQNETNKENRLASLPDVDDCDLTSMVARPLYLGMMINIIIPAGLLFGCYYISNRFHPANQVPSIANGLFYTLCALALAQAAVAIWLRNQRWEAPMVRSAQTFELDIGAELLKRSKPIFMLIAAISLWGFIYFGLTGRFVETMIFVLFSFVVFQVVRPRYGSVRKLVIHQLQLAERSEFMAGGLAEIRRDIESE